jgi:D-alanine-D-alanine ligase
MTKEKTVAVMFGGRSSEHEISIITALQAISAMNTLRYRIVPLYVDLKGKWYMGEALLQQDFYKSLPNNLKKVTQVTLLPDPTIQGIVPISSKGTLSLRDAIPIDVYFLAFHGQYGEDGCIQGLLEMADAAYTGCGVLSSAAAMNKQLCKMLLKEHGISVLPSVVIRRQEPIQDLRRVQKKILSHPGLEAFPLFIKPCHLGSSIGISIAHDIPSLNAALANVFKYDDEAIIEPCVTDILEINVAVLEGNPPIASVVEIPISSGQALTYEDKYMRGGSKTSEASQGMAGLTRIIDPTDLPEAIRKRVTDDAIKAFHLLRCSGTGRFDFIYDTGRDQLYFNELNPIPGSLAFYLWEKSHPALLYTEVIDRVIIQAEQRKAQRLALEREVGFKALK